MSTNHPRRRAAVGATAAIAGLLLAGCGSNATAKSGAAPTTGGGTTSATQQSSGASSSASSKQSTTAKATGSGGKFCSQLEAIGAAEAKAHPGDGTDATDFKQAAQEYESIKGPLLKSAPGEIKPDLATLFDYLDQIYGAMGKAGYDWTKVDPATLATMAGDAQKVEAAGEHITAYVRDNCGIDLEGSAASSSASN